MGKETLRNHWQYMEWTADWQEWQQKFEALVNAQDATVFTNTEASRPLFRQLPNAQIVDVGGAKNLHLESDLIMVSRTLNTAVVVDSSVDLELIPDMIIGAVIVAGASGPQETAFELFDSVPEDPAFQVFGVVTQDYGIYWFNGTSVQFGESSRRIFSGMAVPGVEAYQVGVTGADTTPGFLSSKVQSVDGTVAITVVNPGANEILDLSVPSASNVDKYVKVRSTDTTPGYLASKAAAGAGIKLSVLNGSANEVLRFEYGDQNTFMVKRGATWAESGTALVAAYAAAKLASPSSSNRIKIELLPGVYEVPSTFVMDTDYIDLICADEARLMDWIGAPSADDVKLAGAMITGAAMQTYHTVTVSARRAVFRGIGFTSMASTDVGRPVVFTGGTDGLFLLGCSLFQLGGFGPTSVSAFKAYMEECHAVCSFFGAETVFSGTAYRCTSTMDLLSGEIDSARISHCVSATGGFAGSSGANITDSYIEHCRCEDGDAFGAGVLSFVEIHHCIKNGTGVGFGYDGSGDPTYILLNGCIVNGLTAPMGGGGVSSGWAGRAEFCRFESANDEAVIALSSASESEFSFCIIGGSPVGDASPLSSYTGSFVTPVVVKLRSCFLKNQLSGMIHLKEAWAMNDMPPHPDSGVVHVQAAQTDLGNGAALAWAFQYAKLMTPGGLPKTVENRVTIMLDPVTYQISGSPAYSLDSTFDYIDVVGVGMAGKDNWDRIPCMDDVIRPRTRLLTVTGSDLMFRTAGVSDMRWKNIHFHSAFDMAGGAFDVSSSDDLSKFMFENCVIEIAPRMVSISNISQSNPAVVTASVNLGQSVQYETMYLYGWTGMPELLPGAYRAEMIDAYSFKLLDVDSTAYTAYTVGGLTTRGPDARMSCFWTEGAPLAAQFKNCHFIGKVNTNGSPFRGRCIDCSFTDVAFPNSQSGAYFENCRFAESAIASAGGQSADSTTIIKNVRSWGGYLGYAPSGFDAVMDDVVVLSPYFLCNNGPNRPKMRRVEARGLLSVMQLGAGAEGDDCWFACGNPGYTGMPIVALNEPCITTTGVTQFVPPSTGVDPVARFTTAFPHGFKVGDRVVFGWFGKGASPESEPAYSPLNKQCLKVINVSDTTHFDVELALTETYGTVFEPGFVSKHGVRFDRCRFTTYDEYPLPSTSGSVFTRMAPPMAGLTVRDCIFDTRGNVFNTSGYMDVLVDCTSYDNILLVPHRNECRIKCDFPRLSDIERGRMFGISLIMAGNMAPSKRYTRDSANKVYVELGPGVYDLSVLEEFGGLFAADAIPLDNIEIHGVGDVAWSHPCDGSPSFAMSGYGDFIRPLTRILSKSSSQILSLSPGNPEGFVLSRLSIEADKVSDAPVVIWGSGDNCAIKNCVVERKAYEFEITDIENTVNPIVTYSGLVISLDSFAVYISGLDGMTELNDRWFETEVVGANQFRLKRVDTTAFSAFGTTGLATIRKGAIYFSTMNNSVFEDSVFVGGNMSESSIVDSTVKNCLFLGHSRMANLSGKSVVEDCVMTGNGPGVNGTISPSCAVRRCKFGGSAFSADVGRAGAIVGVVEDCVGYREMLSYYSGSVNGIVRRLRAVNDRYPYSCQLNPAAILEDCEFLISDSAANRFVIVGPGTTLRRVRIVGAPPYEAISSAGSFGINLMFCEIEGSIGALLYNLVGDGHNIVIP